MHPGYGKNVLRKPRISTRVEDACSIRLIMASRVKGQLAASKPSKIPANATIPANPQRTYLPRVLALAVVSGGTVAVAMADYLDAEDGQASASHSLYLWKNARFTLSARAAPLPCSASSTAFS